MSSVRCFVAIALPAEVRRALAAIQPERTRAVRPVPAERLHLTLRFLGDTDPAPVAAALEAVRSPGFSLTLDRRGAFSHRHGHVLWAGFAEQPALQALYAAVTDALGGAGFDPESRPFVPHATLARAKRGYDPDAWLTGPAPRATFAVDAFTLFASVPHEDSVRYDPLATVPLETAGQ